MAKRRSWSLENAERMAKKYPETFEVLPRRLREGLREGDIAKVVIRSGRHSERLWVLVEKAGRNRYEGRLDSQPLFIPLAPGATISFGPEHIYDLQG